MLLRFVKSFGASRGEIRGARGVAVGRSCKAPEAITTGGRVAGSGPRLSARSTVHASNPIRLRFVGCRAAKMHSPATFQHIGMLRALNRHVERVFSDRKDPHWGRRKLARDQ